MPQRSVSPAFLGRHRTALLPLLATLLGLALGLAIHQAAGATASARRDHDRPALQHHTLPLRAVAHVARDAQDLDPRHAPRVRAARARTAAAAAPRPVATPEPGLPAPPGKSRAFAGVRDLTLSLPQGARAIGFHESGTSGAVPMHPMGIPRVNDNLPRLSSAPVGDGFEYLVLGSRGRRNGPTTAVDVSMPFNWPIQSPVTGTVVDAKAYLLYRQVPDNLLAIAPDGRPDLAVVLMHLNGLRVNIGDRVEAGKTVLALTARQLPFGSQIDRHAGRMPHVHLELRPR